MRVLVCGSRDWTQSERIYARLLQLPKGTAIIEGGARGADGYAGTFADDYGYPHIQVAANWEFYEKAAGMIRNSWMLDLQPDLVIAFHPNIESSKGTKDTVTKARKLGIPVEIIQ